MLCWNLCTDSMKLIFFSHFENIFTLYMYLNRDPFWHIAFNENIMKNVAFAPLRSKGCIFQDGFKQVEFQKKNLQ